MALCAHFITATIRQVNISGKDAPESREYITGRLESRRQLVCTVAVDITNAEELGYAIIDEIYTEPYRRKQGYATSLLTELFRTFDTEVPVWQLSVQPFVQESDLCMPPDILQLVRFYEKFGFEVCGRTTYGPKMRRLSVV